MARVRFLIPLLLVLVLALVASCAEFSVGPKPFDEMTPKEKATLMMGMFNSQARDYKAMVARPDLTEDQKVILRKKKQILDTVRPMIKTYNTYIEHGAVPSQEVEDRIMQHLNDLTATIVPKLEGEGG